MLITHGSSSALRSPLARRNGPASETSSAPQDSFTLSDRPTQSDVGARLTFAGKSAMVAAQWGAIFGTGLALRPLIQSASPATAALGIVGLVVGASVLGTCAAIGAAHMLEFGAKSSGHDTFWANAQ